MAVVARHELAHCEGFRVEAPNGLLGWVEEPWLGPGDVPAALAVRTIDGRDGLLLTEDVAIVDRHAERLRMRPGARLLELEIPRVAAGSSNGLVASWRATGAPLEPMPRPPGAVDRALLAIRPWRLAPPPEPRTETPLWLLLVGLYATLTVIVGGVIGVCFLVAWLATGSAV